MPLPNTNTLFLILRAKSKGECSRAQPGLRLSQIDVYDGESCIPQVSGTNLRAPASSVRAVFFFKAMTFLFLLLGRAVNLSLGSCQVAQLGMVGSAGCGCVESKGIPGSVAHPWVGVRSAKPCCMSSFSWECGAGRCQLQGELHPMGTAFLAPVGMGTRYLCGAGGLGAGFGSSTSSWHGRLPTCLPRAGQEVAVAVGGHGQGAPCLATDSFTRSWLCHHRLMCKYKECPAHVNKPSYK